MLVLLTDSLVNISRSKDLRQLHGNGEQHKHFTPLCYPSTSTLKKLLKFLSELSYLSVFQKGSSKSIMDVASACYC